MSKSLIITDIHDEVDLADQIINKESGADRVIILGDCFDSYIGSVYRTARWIKSKLEDPRFTFLLGNHDYHYFAPKHSVVASGFTCEKYWEVNAVLNEDDGKKFKVFDVVDGFLLSHAGFHYDFFSNLKTEEKNLPCIEHYLTEESNYFANVPDNHWFTQIGKARSSFDASKHNKYGGPLWCSLEEFKPIPSISQIFGHTNQNFPYIKSLNYKVDCCYDPIYNSSFSSKQEVNICLDTDLKYYGVIENGTIIIKRSK